MLARDRQRFIPARAGNTRRPHRWHYAPPVHPRSRGEHRLPPFRGDHALGSSPLARGTHAAHPAALPARRFIPARAGNTTWTAWSATATAVHPRSRGEHASFPASTRPSSGSSPLARGTRGGVREVPAGLRFIPARAGNTEARAAPSRAQAVHPRSRGEHELGLPTADLASGSSPLARGTPDPARRLPGGQRFIPARAGNTRPAIRIGSRRPVHPRSRGEHTAIPRSRRHAAGSSPLARGTRDSTIRYTG